jgi:hypothetical protein
MIVSHKHKFIFLKTKKTAGTSIELALSPFCGDSDILVPLARAEETLRMVRGAQNWKLHGWWRSERPIWQRRWFKFNAQDYGFYNHMPAAKARALRRGRSGVLTSNLRSIGIRGTGKSLFIISVIGA